MNSNGGLIVLSGRKYLSRIGWNGGIFFNQLGHNTAHCFYTQRQGDNIQQ
jgi:hypothetical protein